MTEILLSVTPSVFSWKMLGRGSSFGSISATESWERRYLTHSMLNTSSAIFVYIICSSDSLLGQVWAYSQIESFCLVDFSFITVGNYATGDDATKFLRHSRQPRFSPSPLQHAICKVLSSHLILTLLLLCVFLHCNCLVINRRICIFNRYTEWRLQSFFISGPQSCITTHFEPTFFFTEI